MRGNERQSGTNDGYKGSNHTLKTASKHVFFWSLLPSHTKRENSRWSFKQKCKKQTINISLTYFCRVVDLSRNNDYFAFIHYRRGLIQSAIATKWVLFPNLFMITRGQFYVNYISYPLKNNFYGLLLSTTTVVDTLKIVFLNILWR